MAHVAEHDVHVRVLPDHDVVPNAIWTLAAEGGIVRDVVDRVHHEPVAGRAQGLLPNPISLDVARQKAVRLAAGGPISTTSMANRIDRFTPERR